MLSGLGLAGDEVIDIDAEFLIVLYDWIDGQDLHFGRSAFGTLKKMLDEKGVEVPFEDIAKEALLIDILLGITGPLTDKKIEISMYTMSRVANMHGVDTKSARLEYDDILNISSPFVTLIGGRHYVTVLSVTETEVTYWDKNIGESGGEVTISRKDFENDWNGNVITDASVEPTKLLSDAEARKIKGAFFWLIIAACASFIFSAVTTVITIAISVITTVLATLVTIIGQIGAILVNGVLGIGNLLNFAGQAFMGALGVGSASSVAASGFTFGALVEGATTTLINVGVSYGMSVGLEALGVDPVVSGIISSVVTGGVSGLVGPNGSLGLAFRSAIEWGAAASASMLGQYLDVNPIISDILSMSLGVLQGAKLGGNLTFAKVLDEVIKPLGWELAAYGIQYAGMELGLDPGISSLAALTIRSSLQAGLSGFGNGGGSPGDWLAGGIAGAMQGVSKIGINYLVDELELPPIIEQMGSKLLGQVTNSLIPGIANAFGSVFNSYLGNALTAGSRPDRAEDKYWTINPVTGEKEFILDTYASDMAEWSWREDGYKHMAEDFTSHIQSQGFEKAMNDYAVSLFNQESLDAIDTFGMSTGDYFKDKLDNNAFELAELVDGVNVAKVSIDDTFGNNFGYAYFMADSMGGYSDLYGYNDTQREVFGDIFVDPYNDLRIMNGQIIETVDDYTVSQMINNGMREYMYFNDLYGELVLGINPIGERESIYINEAGELTSGMVENYIQGVSYSYEDGKMFDFISNNFNNESNFNLMLSGETYSGLLFSTVENGEIVVDSLAKREGWLNISNEVDSTVDITSNLIGVCDMALSKIAQGQDVNLGEITSQSEWQTILNNSAFMNNWSGTATTIFSNVLNSALAPGTNIFTNILGDDAFKEELLGQAENVQDTSSYYKELAELALGIMQPGSSVVVDSVNMSSFWQGLKTNAQNLWGKKDLIATTTNEVAQFITNPSKYINDRFWASDIGGQFMQEVDSYYENSDLADMFSTISVNAISSGAASALETIGYDSVWSGLRGISDYIWDNRSDILNDASEMYSFATDPHNYLWNKFMETENGRTYQDQILEFYGLKEPNTYVSEVDPTTKTLKIDPDLNYGNIWEKSVLGFLDSAMLLQTANVRWNEAADDAALECNNLSGRLLSGEIRGFSISGINTDGVKLDELTQDLASAFLGTYSITHSAGSSGRIRSDVWTDKNIIISPQEKRVDVENWMDQMGYTSDNVLIVDIAGDLPYRPVDVLNVGLEDMMNLTDPVNLFTQINSGTQNIVDIINDNAYNDYSQNPNNKYTYVRIVDGPDVGSSPLYNHSIGVDGALDPNKKYRVEVNGVVLPDEVTLIEIYEKFLQGEL
ncbi:cysteine peptidase family C39 domain-containing protein [Candidatus Omnitrophota bacterium]